MAKTSGTSPLAFLQEVKQEGRKVTWPTRKETMASTLMVMLMVFIAAIFFLLTDWVFSTGIQAILGM